VLPILQTDDLFLKIFFPKTENVSLQPMIFSNIFHFVTEILHSIRRDAVQWIQFSDFHLYHKEETVKDVGQSKI